MFLHEKESFELHTESMESISMSPSNMTLQLLYSAVIESACEDRLVQGPDDCIKLLDRNPTKIAVCLMPVDDSEENVNLSIQLILIESICKDYNIPVVKVDKAQITDVLLSSMSESMFGTKVSQKTLAFFSDLDCCFIQSQEDDLGANEKKLMNLLHDFQNDRLDQMYSDFPM